MINTYNVSANVARITHNAIPSLEQGILLLSEVAPVEIVCVRQHANFLHNDFFSAFEIVLSVLSTVYEHDIQQIECIITTIS